MNGKSRCLCAVTAAVLLCLPIGAQLPPPTKTEDFEFVSGGKKLSGLLARPTAEKARALILFVHGSGGTDVRGTEAYSDLRSRFGELKIASATWDKPGQGRSEGNFDPNQPLDASAREVLDAAAHLRARRVPGSELIGIWSTSRGCWVAPIAMSQDAQIRFWISVSGVPAEDNKYYLLESNLPLEGRSPDQTTRLMTEWRRGRQIFIEGGSYGSYLKATENLRKDPAVTYFAGDLSGTQKDYESEQAAYLKQKDQFEFDQETLSVVQVRNFDKMLSGLNIDVLAIFGEKDTNVNWRKARALYESTIGRNSKATLEVRTFPDGNHALAVTKTGSVREVEGMPLNAGVKCEGYYETQVAWLRKHVVR